MRFNFNDGTRWMWVEDSVTGERFLACRTCGAFRFNLALTCL